MLEDVRKIHRKVRKIKERLQWRMQRKCGGREEDTLENAGDTRRVQWRMQTICGGYEEDTFENTGDINSLQWRMQTTSGGFNEDTYIGECGRYKEATMEDADDMWRM